jgi:RNA polymerase sigma-70 factor (ECF subfamily)
MEDGKSEKPAERAELRRKIHAAINQLSPKLRVATILALIEEESYAEIAESLGISVNAVKVRVFRGVRVLRKELEKEGIRP